MSPSMDALKEFTPNGEIILKFQIPHCANGKEYSQLYYISHGDESFIFTLHMILPPKERLQRRLSDVDEKLRRVVSKTAQYI